MQDLRSTLLPPRLLARARRSPLVVGAIAWGCLLSATGTAAVGEDTSAVTTGEPRASSASAQTLHVSLGPATFLRARSLALEHRVRPLLRAAWTWQLTPRLRLGPAVSAVVGTDSNYGVWNAYAQARYALVQSETLRFSVVGGLGVGYDAPILHRDLQTAGSALPYGELSLDLAWPITERWGLGVELGAAQLSVIHLSGSLFARF